MSIYDFSYPHMHTWAVTFQIRMSSDTEIRVENMLAGIHGVDASSSVNGRNVVEKYPEPTAVAPYKLGAGKEGLASSMSAAHIDKDKLNAELRDNQRLLKVCI